MFPLYQSFDCLDWGMPSLWLFLLYFCCGLQKVFQFFYTEKGKSACKKLLMVLLLQGMPFFNNLFCNL